MLDDTETRSSNRDGQPISAVLWASDSPSLDRIGLAVWN